MVSLDTITEMPDNVQKITGITKLNNYEFSSKGSITCWHAYSVGQGKVIKLEKSSSGRYGDSWMNLSHFDIISDYFC